MRSRAISVGRFLGVDVLVHWTFFFLLAFVLLSDPNGPHTAGVALRGAAVAGIVLLSVILHELAHLILNKAAGTAPKAVVLLPIGGVSLQDETQQPVVASEAWKQEIQIALAGPMINFAVAAAIAGVILGWLPQVHLFERPYIHYSNLPRTFFWCNVGLGLLNLLPGYPLDGGRVLRAIFSRTADPTTATRKAVSLGQMLATAFIISGMFQFFNGGGPEVAWLCMTGFFLFIAAQLEERSAVFHSVLETVHLEDVMLTDFATLSPADTLEDALDKAVHTLQDDFPVVRGGDMVGMISRQRILEALRAEGNGYVQSVMNKMFEVAQKKESLASAFRKLTTRNLNLIPVVEDQRLVGIVTLQNLMHSMTLLAESRKLKREAN